MSVNYHELWVAVKAERDEARASNAVLAQEAAQATQDAIEARAIARRFGDAVAALEELQPGSLSLVLQDCLHDLRLMPWAKDDAP